MSFGLTPEKILVILVIALFIVGPQRLPQYAAQFGRLVRRARDIANGARERVREEMGPEFDDVDWAKLDPRQYDPRRIIRDALLEDLPTTAAPEPPARSSAAEFDPSSAAPFDSEST